MQPDFVIVGAGSGGCVLARRLLDAGARVLLLEAGGPDTHPMIGPPAGFPKLFKSRVDWNFHTAPQVNLGGRRLYWPRGKVLGGSSAINATIYIRGSKQDFGGWTNASGEPVPGWGEGWSWNDVLPVYRSLEKFRGQGSETRSSEGLLPVGQRDTSHPLSHAFVDSAARALGIPVEESFNDGQHLGAGLYESNHHLGVRQSAYRAFLASERGNPRLTVLTQAQMLALRWEGNRVVGLTFRYRGRVKEVRAGGVVLAAGAVQTPQLLLLSGIGPRDELDKHNIGLRVHSPGVGENLQDHLAVPVIFRSKVPSLDAVKELPALAEWVWRRRGPLTSNVAEAGAFAHARPGLLPSAPPDIQYHFGPAYFREHGFQKVPGNHFSVGPVLVDVHSRGRITLHSADPDAAPIIDPRYLSDERDTRSLIAGMRLARRVAAEAPLADVCAGEALPGEEAQSDDDLLAHLRRDAETLYHPVGTAAMGDTDFSVVDRRLAVRGAAGLWVADASVMPRIIHANTNATAMMIGARAAAFLLEGGA
ncbi:choline dehydrogenase [Deinococcus irradiatisoli]|uniref:Choline dehydrogenase n=1 Tax=Deinococcus irradiatisoli TaxID=2202254 RepID=A0A2Z3JFE3_9DEIO|nr:GMC family oxidoreductase N-terminal domain-containing protein [Deinococcus irradiatisoli]AWN23883.1 choline dehydrogenase [Deinococcus irradiatisoli]